MQVEIERYESIQRIRRKYSYISSAQHLQGEVMYSAVYKTLVC